MKKSDRVSFLPLLLALILILANISVLSSCNKGGEGEEESTPVVSGGSESTSESTEETTAPDGNAEADLDFADPVLYEGDVLVVENDRDPFTGRAVKAAANSGNFVLDKNLNSTVIDLGAEKKVNRVTLTSKLNISFINKSLYSVYYSNDNENYTYLENFSILRSKTSLYFYNFEVDARYIKIHSTANADYDTTGKLLNDPEKIISACYSEAPLLSEGAFAGMKTVKVENSKDKVVFDEISKFTLEELGIDESALRFDKGDIRFVCDGKYLPHFNIDDTFYVRVLEIGAEESATINVYYGNESALPVSDGEETFEIVYGTKYSKLDDEDGWDNSIATMPNGDLLRIVDLEKESGNGRELAMFRSKDGGLTWSDYERIPGTDMTNQGGSFIVDYKLGKVFYFGFHYQYTPYICPFYIFESNDNGYTWTGPVTPALAPEYALTYSDGITLSTADGDGPEVDYVLTTAAMRDVKTASFCTTSVYSKDGGKSWTFSTSRINFEDDGNTGFEKGLSEDCVIERKDGSLILYARCQVDGVNHFAVARSYDKGVTWTNIGADDFSNFYTPNTQPIMEKLNGIPVFLWAGNNTLGATTYLRYPLNLAPSYDEAETFTDYVDASFGTILATVNRKEGRSLHTNPDLTFHKYAGIDSVYIVSTKHQMYVLNVDDFLYKTKGAFDSFESGAISDGWLVATGGVSTTGMGSTDGQKALLIEEDTIVTRPLHYIEEGVISFDINAKMLGSGVAIEFQTSFDDRHNIGISPMSLFVDATGSLKYYNENKNLIDTGIDLTKGDNTFTLTFNGNEKTATVTVNGKSADIKYVGDEKYISYVTFFTNPEATPAIDRFIAIKED